jgi:hypothetical protein
MMDKYAVESTVLGTHRRIDVTVLLGLETRVASLLEAHWRAGTASFSKASCPDISSCWISVRETSLRGEDAIGSANHRKSLDSEDILLIDGSCLHHQGKY